MKYSKYDLVMVAVVVLQFCLLITWARSYAEISLGAHLLAFAGMLVLAYYNPIVVTHNFLHTPFFTHPALNRLFTLFNSMNLGLPQILYKYHHLNHHRHNNSLEDPSSTFLYGKDGQQEHWVKYAALGIVRDGTQRAWVQAIEKGEGHILYAELACALSFWGLLAWIDWRFFVFAYAPYYFCQWFLAHVENYYEHFKASHPENRYANSVSFYPRWYNALMFNEGYHQEHHISPQEHWSKRPATRERYRVQMQEARAYEAKLPPLLGMLE